MSQSEDEPNMPLGGASASGSGESVARTIARLETAVVRLRAALAREQGDEVQGSDAQAAELAAENALLRAERDRLQQDLAALRRAHEDLKRRSDSAGVKITRTIEELEAMLGEAG